MRACVITVSDRCASGARDDRSGPVLVDALTAGGWRVTAAVVPDGADSVGAAIGSALETGADLIVTTGGTGVGPRDRTPEGTRPLLDRELPGIAEALRRKGAEASPHAWLSRGVAGVVDPRDGRPGALVVNLPGSPGGARDGVHLLLGLAPHVVSQLAGGDHR